MQNIIDFITNNYLWFLIITLIIIFILIGYLVEITNNKNINSKKSEKKN